MIDLALGQDHHSDQEVDRGIGIIKKDQEDQGPDLNF